jgi:hypothetical protein
MKNSPKHLGYNRVINLLTQEHYQLPDLKHVAQ